MQGLELSAQDIQIQLSRRRPGQSDLTTPVCSLDHKIYAHLFILCIEKRKGSSSAAVWPGNGRHVGDPHRPASKE